MKITDNLRSLSKSGELNKTRRQNAKLISNQDNPNKKNQFNDPVEISEEGRQRATESINKSKNGSKNEPNNVFFDIDQFREQLKNAKEAAKSTANANEIKLKCMEIARRIQRGDEVPDEDHRFLLLNEPGMYMQAMTMKMQNDDPKKHNRLSEDEETDGDVAVQIKMMESSFGSSPSVPTSTAAEPGDA